MASITINGGTIFPEGTSVSAYLRSQWPAFQPPSGAPSGSAVDTGTITGGQVTFTGLADNTPYVAYASSIGRYKAFSTPSGGTGFVSTEEQFFHIFDDTSALADASRKRFGVPFDLEVISLSVWSLAAVSASATDYWTCDLRKIIAADVAHTPQLIASKTTQLEPTGEAFLAFTPWTFDTVEFDPVNAFCVQGDTIDILWTKTLSPTAPSRMSYALRYRPV